MQAGLRKFAKSQIIAGTALALLVACAPTPDVVVAGPEQEVANTSGLQEKLPDTCKLDNYRPFVGQPLSVSTIPATTKSRIVRPGTILTQEYVADRVNFYVDGNGTVSQVTCG